MKKLALKLYLAAHGAKVGSGLKCKQWPILRAIPFGNIILGNHVTIGYGVTLDIPAGGYLEIGHYVNLTHNVTVSATASVSIGEFCQIAENVSIRDGEHGSALGREIVYQDNVTKPVFIGRDVWVGANSVILKGVTVPDGAIIGANSMVIWKNSLEANGIYAGNPVKMIGRRVAK